MNSKMLIFFYGSPSERVWVWKDLASPPKLYTMEGDATASVTPHLQRVDIVKRMLRHSNPFLPLLIPNCP
jgi:hypothetical protein